jgi:flagellar motor switch protein FliG
VYTVPVTAIEVIHEIKSLPPKEREQVIDFVEEIKKHSPVNYASDDVFNAAAEKVFAKHSELLRRLAS